MRLVQDNGQEIWPPAVRRLAILTVLLGSPLAVTPASAQTSPLKVVVTIKPVHALALQVLDGVTVPKLVVDGSASPHTYALKPSDAKLLNDADVVVRVSETLEPFTAKIVKSLPKTVGVVTLDKAPGMTLLSKRTSATFETGETAGKAHKGHSHGHNHGNTKNAVDGHLWLDTNNGKAIVAELARITIAKRPLDAEKIKANAAKAVARLDLLAAEIAGVLGGVKEKPFVVFHDATQYFESRFGLTSVGSITVDPEVPPSAKRLTDVRAKIKTLSAACVFSEPGYETKVVQSIIEGTSAKTAALDPEGLTVESGQDAYDMLMRRLAGSFRSCLSPAS